MVDTLRDISKTSPADHAAASDRLMQLLAGVGQSFGYERSWRITHRALLTNRFLLTTDMPSFGSEAERIIAELCRQLHMPTAYRRTIGFHLPAARFVHFGFEAGTGRNWYKVYLEFAADPDAPSLQHLAFKWDASGSGAMAVTRYVRYPISSHQEVVHRLAEIHAADASTEPFEIVRAMVGMTTGRMSPQQLQYLEVREDGSDRRSYDLNLYDSGLLLRDLWPLLFRMCARHEIAPQSLEAAYEPIQSSRVGCIASGTHRDSKGFFTVYFGAGPWAGHVATSDQASRGPLAQP